MIQAPFSNGGSPTPDNQSETRFTYFPSASTGEGAVTSQADVSTATAIGPVTTAGGKFHNTIIKKFVPFIICLWLWKELMFKVGDVC